MTRRIKSGERFYVSSAYNDVIAESGSVVYAGFSARVVAESGSRVVVYGGQVIVAAYPGSVVEFKGRWFVIEVKKKRGFVQWQTLRGSR